MNRLLECGSCLHSYVFRFLYARILLRSAKECAAITVTIICDFHSPNVRTGRDQERREHQYTSRVESCHGPRKGQECRQSQPDHDTKLRILRAIEEDGAYARRIHQIAHRIHSVSKTPETIDRADRAIILGPVCSFYIYPLSDDFRTIPETDS